MELERGYEPDLWRKIADLGWHGLMIPAEFGGSGLSFYDLCVVIEEAGDRFCGVRSFPIRYDRG